MSEDATKPAPPPEAALIRLAREAAHIKTPDAAKAAGISTARWSHIENGYETRHGGYKPVRGRAVTIAHMASAVGLTPDRLEGAGRADAAAILAEIRRVAAQPHAVSMAPTDAYEREVAATPGLSEETIAQLFRAHRLRPSARPQDGDDQGEDLRLRA